jgi:GNAT superfamily N-acetyltransferase
MRIQVEPFSESHLDDAARLLAQRHRADRLAAPELPARFENAGDARTQIQAACARERTSGVVALQGGRLAGFLLGSIVLPPPSAFWAGILAPRSVEMPYAGYAAVEEEAIEIYREMYAALAGDWSRAGCFSHFIEVQAGDRAALTAWFSLGFGQYLTLAARDTEPVPSRDGPQPGVEIRRVGVEEIDVIMRLSEGLWRHHSMSPMFAPVLPEALPELRSYQQGLLAGAENAFWVAYQSGRPVAMQTFHQQTHAEIARPDGGVYLFEGYSEPDSRGSGAGTALLRRTMDWARSAGYDACTLHYFAANLSGARFWRRSGFRPLTHRLVRRIDERIAWASGDR